MLCCCYLNCWCCVVGVGLLLCLHCSPCLPFSRQVVPHAYFSRNCRFVLQRLRWGACVFVVCVVCGCRGVCNAELLLIVNKDAATP